MTITLSKRTEEIVLAQLETGRYATADEVVNQLIEERIATAALPDFSSVPDADEIKSSLLAAVTKPTSQYREGEFVELARRAVAEDRGT